MYDIYIYTHIYMYVCMYLSIYIYTHAHTHTHSHIYLHIHIYICIPAGGGTSMPIIPSVHSFCPSISICNTYSLDRSSNRFLPIYNNKKKRIAYSEGCRGCSIEKTRVRANPLGVNPNPSSNRFLPIYKTRNREKGLKVLCSY